MFKKKEKEEAILGLPEKFTNAFIQPLSSNLIEVKLGQKLKVPANYWAVIVVNDKPQDVFTEGEWELIIPNLPRVTNTLKLDKSKVVKSGSKQELVFQNSFKCDIYFVSKEIFINQQWETNLIYKKAKGYKRFGVLLSGECDIQCVEPAKMISLLKLEWAKIDNTKALPRIRKYLCDFANEGLDWAKISKPHELYNQENASKILLARVEKNFNKYGIKVINFRVKKAEFGREMMAMFEQELRDNKLNGFNQAEAKTNPFEQLSNQNKKSEEKTIELPKINLNSN